MAFGMLIADMSIPTGRSSLTIVLATALALPFALTGCHGGPGTGSIPGFAAERQQALEAARQQMELIPPPSKSRYMAVQSLNSWENPYVTVQGGMVTLHVLIGDANPSTLGVGGLLRPVNARRRNLDVRLSDLPTALNAIPESAWPYGRVVAIEEAHDAPANARPQIRRNVEAVLKTLGDLGVVAYEWNDTGHGV
jgi:hypothetical protein